MSKTRLYENPCTVTGGGKQTGLQRRPKGTVKLGQDDWNVVSQQRGGPEPDETAVGKIFDITCPYVGECGGIVPMKWG